MSLGARILGAETDPVVALHEELSGPAGARGELPVAGPGLLPVHVVLLALAAGPPALRVVSEDLAGAAGSFALQLEALGERREVVGVVGLTAAVRGLTSVVVREERAQLTRSLGEVFIAELERGVVVLVEKDGVTATVRLCGDGVPDEEVSLVARSHSVQLVAGLVRRPED